MSIGLFIDGSFVYKSFPDQIDYLKLRGLLESELDDKIDEAYYFNSDNDPPKATKFNNYLTVPPPNGPGFRLKIYWLSKKKLFWPQSLGGHPVLHPNDPIFSMNSLNRRGLTLGWRITWFVPTTSGTGPSWCFALEMATFMNLCRTSLSQRMWTSTSLGRFVACLRSCGHTQRRSSRLTKSRCSAR